MKFGTLGPYELMIVVPFYLLTYLLPWLLIFGLFVLHYRLRRDFKELSQRLDRLETSEAEQYVR